MTKTALIFTGQGSQIVGMGKDFYEKYPCSKEIFETFDKITGKNITELTFNGNEEDLKLTINAQPCILATEIAILKAFQMNFDDEIHYAAGHSLGEYAALYAAGVINLADTIKLINARATAMSKINKGSMSAIIALNDEILEKIIKEVSVEHYVDIANYNTPGQTVITGETEGVKKAGVLALQNGAKKVIPLSVSGAFHSKLMKDSAKEFELTVKNVELNDARLPVITNLDALPTIKAEDFRHKMTEQIYSPVQWVKTLNRLNENGVEHFIEIGPSKILSGMVKRTLKDVKISAICRVEDLESLIKVK